MTKKELITLLEQYPDDQEVLIAAEDREYKCIDYFSKIAIESVKIRYSTWVIGDNVECDRYYDCDNTLRDYRNVAQPFIEKEVIVLEAK